MYQNKLEEHRLIVEILRNIATRDSDTGFFTDIFYENISHCANELAALKYKSYRIPTKEEGADVDYP